MKRVAAVFRDNGRGQQGDLAAVTRAILLDPEARGRGDGARGLRDLCTLLLAEVPQVCLFVRRENAAAIALYDAVGMKRVLEYRSVLF